jgi:hypothetical protein
MATQIQRVRFFDGQFLKEVDFRDEQNYHLHMRRRMNFFLFGQSGVIPIGPDDLKFFALNNVNKTFSVRAGMAICRRPDRMEGKEIILAEDSEAIDLDNYGITAGGTAYVTLHFSEEELKDPPSEGDVDENTRYREKAVLSVHSAPPAGMAPGGEEYILLGTIAYNTMTPDYTLRHEARLRAALFQTPPAPSITSVSGSTSATPGSPAVNMVINGLNLTGATAVSFSDPAVTGTVINATATTVTVTVTAGPSATFGPKSFQVTTPAGVANSPAGVGFTVAAPTPAITGINVHTANQGSSVSAIISGTNLAGATSVTFSGTGVSASIQAGGTATSLPISISINGGAATGLRTFTVTTPNGSASNSGVVGADFSVTPPAPTITGISVHTAVQGATNISATITGTDLQGATSVVFSGVGVTASIGAGGTATSLPITITVAAGATAGARTFTVTTPGGTANSTGVSGADFTVTLNVQLISIVPNQQITGSTVELHGVNIRDSNLGAGLPATGTLVQLRGGGFTKPAGSPTIIANDSQGRQVVQVTIPDRSGTTWTASTTVSMEVTFGGVTVSLPFTFLS